MEPECCSALPATTEMSQFPRILLVEDTPLNQTLVLKQLERLGYQADLAENGQQALHSLSQTKYDIVLMDCQMPILDGYSTTEIIRNADQTSWANLVIIAMTASATLVDQQRCLEAGMNDYLSKPVSKETLADRLHYWKQRLSERHKLETQVGLNLAGRDRQHNQEADPTLLKSNAQPVELDSNSDPRLNSVPMKDPKAAILQVGLTKPLIDWDYLQNMTGGDEAFSWDLLQIFVEDNQPLIPLLAEAIVQVDFDRVKQLAHRLKGSSGNVGLRSAYQIAARLESQAARQEHLGMKSLCDAMSGLVQQLAIEVNTKKQA